HFVDPAAGGSVDLDHRGRDPVPDLPAGDALPARSRGGTVLTVERASQQARGAGLPGPARAAEQVRMAHAAGADRVLKGPGDVLLAGKLFEALRAVFAIEGEVGHR